MVREIIKKIMRSQGWEMVLRPNPEIEIKGERAYYSPSSNTIALPLNRQGKSLIEAKAHELCHSLQAMPDSYIAPKDGVREYLGQEVEKQAYAIGDFLSQYTPKYTPWDKLPHKPARSERLAINAMLRAWKEVIPIL